jgi:hypothetical protein
MSRYGLDYYSPQTFPLSYYGSDNPLTFDASPVTAISSGYLQVTLKWASPLGEWDELKVMRSPYGYPVNITDGTNVFTTFKSNPTLFYADNIGLDKPKFYYYSLFVHETTQDSWVLAGRVIGFAVPNYGTGDRLYDLMPGVTKITTPYVASSAGDNEDLRSFLSLFGYQFDYIRGLTNTIYERYNFEQMSDTVIPLLLSQFGIKYEPEIGFQNSRVLVRDSVQLSKEKGSAQGIREYIKAFTGWSCPSPIDGAINPVVEGIQTSHNLMLDYNDSSFEEGVGRWESDDNSGTVRHIKLDTVTSYFVTSNTLHLNIGENGYDVGDYVTLSGFKIPKFNSITPIAILGTDPTGIDLNIVAPNIALVSAFNEDTQDYPVVTPYPAPRYEATSPALYPNKQKGYLSLANAGATAAVVTASCGSTNPIVYGVPVISGDSYTFSAYSAASVTSRTFTVGISWYDRLGVFMSTKTGDSVSNVAGSFSARGFATGTAPCNITFNSYNTTAGTGYVDGTYANVPLTYVSGKQPSILPRVNVTIFGGAVISIAVINGGKGADTTTIFTLNKTDIGSATGSGFLVTTKLVQESYYAVPTISVSSVGNAESHEHHYFDNCQFEQASSATDFDEARQSHITLKANRINELINPTFYNVSSFAPWSVTNGTLTRPDSLTPTVTSTASGNVTLKSFTNNTQYMKVFYQDTAYTFSVYVKGGSQTNGSGSVNITWYNAAKTELSTSAQAITFTSSDYSRVSVSAIAPSTAAYATVSLVWNASSASKTVLVKEALFENSGLVLDYFDGTNGRIIPGSDLFWEGSQPNQGRSHYYKNRTAIQIRITKGALDDWITSGSTYAIYLAQPNT